MSKLRIFISHPYAADPEGNIKKVDEICKDLWEQSGHIPISPLHLFSFMTDDRDRYFLLQACEKLIDMCDVVYVYGDTPGCDAEYAYAIKVGKPVTRMTVHY